MGIKRHRPEEIVTKLRQVEVLVGQGMARICRVLVQHKSTQRRRPRGRADEEHLVADTINLVRQ